MLKYTSQRLTCSNQQKRKAELNHLLNRNNRQNNRFFNVSYRNTRIRNKIINTEIYTFCRSLKFKYETFYLTVALIDCITSKYLFDNQMFREVAFVCLTIAAKIKESRVFYLRLNQAKKIKSVRNREELERQILFDLDFDADVVTPFDFAMSLMQDDQVIKDIAPKKRRQFFSQVYLICFGLSMEYRSNQFDAIVVACCVLMRARSSMRLSPSLPKSIVEFCGLSQGVLVDCFKKIYFLKTPKVLDFREKSG